MATYSSVNQETIELFQYKEVVEASTTYNKTLVSSVAANEMYELYENLQKENINNSDRCTIQRDVE